MKKKAVKLLSILLAAALLIGASVGGTLAYLSAKSDTVVNTFTVGNINIKLEETDATDENGDKIFDKSFKMVPGSKIAKDPKITVADGSEDCYLFVEIKEGDKTDNLITTETGDPATYITYAVADGWTPVTSTTGVYYRTVAATDSVKAFSVLKDDQVVVANTVTKAMMDNDTNVGKLTLSFTAYAVQSANIPGNSDAEKAATAWDVAQNDGVPTNP